MTESVVSKSWMLTFLKTCVLLPLLLYALLLPKVSAVLLDIHPGIQVAVICTGTEIVTVRIGPDGIPIETGQTDDAPCLAADTPPNAAQPIPAWVTLARNFKTPFVAVPSTANRHNPALLNRESQAPPVSS
ncbi:MAG: hypothetical protein AAFX07_09005 [Pseudomonadota bacterium]